MRYTEIDRLTPVARNCKKQGCIDGRSICEVQFSSLLVRSTREYTLTQAVNLELISDKLNIGALRRVSGTDGRKYYVLFIRQMASYTFMTPLQLMAHEDDFTLGLHLF